MCDTHVLIKNKVVYFAKNSDREPGEAQLVIRLPAASTAGTLKQNATYITLDAAPFSHGVILSKPFWTWGAEMGVNDHGVVIGNEAVFTRLMENTRGLIGMDLVRLGLERGATAEHAMQVIIELIEAHGQGGPCGFRDKTLHYDNSFIIADPSRAWVLETAGRFWAAREVTTFAAISNCLTIGPDYDRKSEGLEDKARKGGFFRGRGDFSFKKAFDTRLLPFFAGARRRVHLGRESLQRTFIEDAVHPRQMMMNLRAHHDPDATPATGDNRDICMHAGGFIRRSQTCGSMVSRLSADGCLHFFTGTSAPCLSMFKPADFNDDIAYCVLNPDERTVEGSLWRKNEHVHRRLLFLEEERQEFQEALADAENRMLAVIGKNYFRPSADDLHAADGLARQWTDRWCEKYKTEAFHYPRFSVYGRFWRRANERDGFF